MSDQEKPFLSIKAQKGGPGKTSNEYSIVDAVIDMAESHARIALGTVLLNEHSEAELDQHVTAVVDQVLASLLPNPAAADMHSKLETIYRESFWRRSRHPQSPSASTRLRDVCCSR